MTQCLSAVGIDFKGHVGKRRAGKTVALLICVVFIAAFVLSTTFIITHADHQHDFNGPHGTCATCAGIAAAGNLLMAVSIAFSGVSLSREGLPSLISIFKRIVFRGRVHTLIRLKVRLDY